MSNIAQRSFAGGEIAPGLYARTDVAKYGTALRTCRNFVVNPAGGVSNRPGTEYVGEAKDSAIPVRLIKFVFNADQTYVLEFGHQYMRVIRQGAPIVVTNVPAWNAATPYAVGALVTANGVNYYCRSANTNQQPSNPTFWYLLAGDIYEIPTPYAAADLAALQFVQSADVVTLVHPSYPPATLSRTGHTTWVLTGIVFGASLLPPSDITMLVHGGAGPVVYWAVTSLNEETGEESVPVVYTNGLSEVPAPATPVTLAWSPVAEADRYHVYRSTDRTTFGFVGIANAAAEDSGNIQTTSWTDNKETVTTSSPTGTTIGSGQARITVLTGGADKPPSGQFTVRGRIAGGVSGGTVATMLGRAHAYYSRDGEPRVNANNVGTFVIIGSGAVNGLVFQGTVIVPDNGYSALVIDVVPEIVGGVVTSGSPFASCVVDFSTAPDNVVSWQRDTSLLRFTDQGADPDFSIQPPVARNPFDAIGKYPSAVGYYQQRQVFGNTNTEPEKVWTSRSGAFRNFTTSTPIQDDDAVTFTLAGREVNAVRHLIDLDKLLVLTQGGVSSVEGDGNGVLTPAAVNARQRSYAGASALRPVVAGNRVIYVDARASILRELVNDEVAGLGSTDLTVFSSHLFQGYGLVDLDLQVNPSQIAWAVRSDGTLLGLTYLPEQQVWGWHRHDTDGVVEQVCVVPEGLEDAVYLVVRRTVNFSDRRYIERLASRRLANIVDACFLDSSVVYDGRNTDTSVNAWLSLSGGTTWGPGETLVLASNGDTRFVPEDVGNAYVFTAADGSQVRCRIIEYQSDTVVLVQPSITVPADLRQTGLTAWARAVDRVTGINHLEGKPVGVFADGSVAASPNNDSMAVVTVAAGAITLDQPYAVIRVGLPYISDLETLDIDTPEGASRKDRAMHIGAVGLSLEASRGVFAGRRAPTTAEVAEHGYLHGLTEPKPRRPDDGYEGPAQLMTDTVHVTIQSNWDSNGRIFVRQVDPVPVTILAAIPQGAI